MRKRNKSAILINSVPLKKDFNEDFKCRICDFEYGLP